MKEYTINRKVYDKVRKMDHKEMTEFFKKTYSEGYAAGKQSTISNVDMKNIILGVKGVGEKKADEILQAIIAAQEERKALTNG